MSKCKHAYLVEAHLKDELITALTERNELEIRAARLRRQIKRLENWPEAVQNICSVYTRCIIEREFERLCEEADGATG